MLSSVDQIIVIFSLIEGRFECIQRIESDHLNVHKLGLIIVSPNNVSKVVFSATILTVQYNKVVR
jgi:hypothetical protein